MRDERRPRRQRIGEGDRPVRRRPRAMSPCFCRPCDRQLSAALTTKAISGVRDGPPRAGGLIGSHGGPGAATFCADFSLRYNENDTENRPCSGEIFARARSPSAWSQGPSSSSLRRPGTRRGRSGSVARLAIAFVAS